MVIAVPIYRDVSAGVERSICFANQRTIEEAVQVFRGDNGDVPDLPEMVEQGYFSRIPRCPDGHAYEMESDGSVAPCSSHGYYRD
mgnify:FL=1